MILPVDYEITTYRSVNPVKEGLRKEVCNDGPGGEWWWGLNDDLLDVGPHPSEEAALEDAIRTLRRAPCQVDTVSYRGQIIEGEWGLSSPVNRDLVEALAELAESWATEEDEPNPDRE